MEAHWRICRACDHPVDAPAAQFCPRCGASLWSEPLAAPSEDATESATASKTDDRLVHPPYWFVTPGLLLLVGCLSPHGREFLLVAAAVVAIALWENLVFSLVGRLFGLHVWRFRLFTGRPVVKLGVFRLGWFPVGSSISFAAREDGSILDAADGAVPTEDLHPLARSIVCLSAALGSLAIGAALLASAGGSELGVDACRQLFSGVWLKSASGASNIRWLLALFSPGGNATVGVGILCVLLSVLNLVPIPLTAGGNAVGAVLEWLTLRGKVWKWWNVLTLPALFVVLAFYLYWFYSLVGVLRKG